MTNEEKQYWWGVAARSAGLDPEDHEDDDEILPVFDEIMKQVGDFKLSTVKSERANEIIEQYLYTRDDALDQNEVQDIAKVLTFKLRGLL